MTRLPYLGTVLPSLDTVLPFLGTVIPDLDTVNSIREANYLDVLRETHAYLYQLKTGTTRDKQYSHYMYLVLVQGE